MKVVLNTLTKHLKEKSVIVSGSGADTIAVGLALSGITAKSKQTVKELKDFDHTYDAVVVVWPSGGSPFPWQLLSRMAVGQELYYLGEGPGGRCANERFFNRLEPFHRNSRVKGQFTKLVEKTEELNQEYKPRFPDERWLVYVKGNDRLLNSQVRKIGRCRYMINGGQEIVTPFGVTRSTNTEAWVSLHGQKRRMFSDSNYRKDPMASLQAAIDYAKIHGFGYSGRGLQTKESETKKIKVGVPGIRCVNFIQKDTNIRTYLFRIAIPGERNKAHSVYIGTENTYQSNWDSALLKARKIRMEVESQYYASVYRKGVSA